MHERAQRLAQLARRLEVGGVRRRPRLQQAAGLQPVGEAGDVVEEVGAVLAVDGVDEHLHEREPPRRGLAAARVDRPAEQGVALHGIVSVTVEYPAPSGVLLFERHMTDQPPMSEADEAALAAYADGLLEPAERSALEARLASEPALAAALEQQRAGLGAITTAAESVSAPLALRSRIEAMQRGEAAPRRRERRRGWGWLPSAGLAAAAAAAVAIVVAFSGGPATAEVLAAAVRPPSPPCSSTPASRGCCATRSTTCASPTTRASSAGRPSAPAPTRSAGATRRRSSTAARAGGSRTRSSRASSSPGRPAPTATELEGTPLRVFEDGDRVAVTWRRNGRTCILSATNVPRDELLELAAWKGQGAVDF